MDSNQEIDIQDMNSQELESFEQLIQQEAENAELPTSEDTEAYKQTLLDFFVSDSNIYQNAEAATEQVIDEINDNHESIFDKIDGEKVLVASHGTISVKLLGSILNVVAAAIGGGVGRIVTNFLEPGIAVAKFIDSQDKIKNNGWIELW